MLPFKWFSPQSAEVVSRPDVGNDAVAQDACAEVMRASFAAGGRMIDSSPMYGSSQDVIGHGLHKLGKPDSLVSADKVWISSGARGPIQIETSRQRWGVPRFDLLQVHNLLSWEEHLPILLRMKGRRPRTLCWDHDVRRPSPSRGRTDHGESADQFRTGDLQRARP